MFKVVAEEDPYFFRDWVGFSGNSDPYEILVTNPLIIPTPLSIYTPCTQNTFIGGTIPAALFKDKNAMYWSRAAGTPIYAGTSTTVQYNPATDTSVLTDTGNAWPPFTDSTIPNVHGYILFIQGDRKIVG